MLDDIDAVEDPRLLYEGSAHEPVVPHDDRVPKADCFSTCRLILEPVVGAPC